MPLVNNDKTTHHHRMSVSIWLLPMLIILFLVSISYFNFLLFHTLTELFAIVIAILTSVVAWNMYPFTRNNYLMFLGTGYFWIGALDLLHTLTYKGMNIIGDTGPNMSVQFWIGTRGFEALLLLAAPWFLTHTFKLKRSFASFGLISIAITYSVFAGLFPDSFIPGEGLTDFKVYSV